MNSLKMHVLKMAVTTKKKILHKVRKYGLKYGYHVRPNYVWKKSLTNSFLLCLKYNLHSLG